MVNVPMSYGCEDPSVALPLGALGAEVQPTRLNTGDNTCRHEFSKGGQDEMVPRLANGLGYRTERTVSESTTHSLMMSSFGGHALRARMITGPARKVGRITVQSSSLEGRAFH
jgi:hypothetical protein